MHLRSAAVRPRAAAPHLPRVRRCPIGAQPSRSASTRCTRYLIAQAEAGRTCVRGARRGAGAVGRAARAGPAAPESRDRHAASCCASCSSGSLSSAAPARSRPGAAQSTHHAALAPGAALAARDGGLRAPPPRGRERRPRRAALHAPRAAPAALRLGRRAAARQHGRAPRAAGGVRRARAAGRPPAGRARIPRDPGGPAPGHAVARSPGGAGRCGARHRRVPGRLRSAAPRWARPAADHGRPRRQSRRQLPRHRSAPAAAGVSGGEAPAAAPSTVRAPPTAGVGRPIPAMQLASIDPRASARAATAAVLAAWGERPLLRRREPDCPTTSRPWCGGAGCRSCTLTANRSMLRLLDLPALSCVRVPARAAALRGAHRPGRRSGRALGERGARTTDVDTFQQLWTGQAHVLWRDFDGLGPTLQPGMRGAAVAQLQELLRRRRGRRRRPHRHVRRGHRSARCSSSSAATGSTPTVWSVR